MSIRQSKLHRRLTGRLTLPMMKVVIGGISYDDDDIVSIRIDHGTQSSEPSVSPTRAEIQLRGKLPIVNGSTVTIRNEAPELVVAGEYDPAWRFKGRVTTQSIDTTRKGDITIIHASAFISLALTSNLDWDVYTAWGHQDVIHDLLGAIQALYPNDFAWNAADVTNDDKPYADEIMTISQGLSKFVTDLGVYFFITRYGGVRPRSPGGLLVEHDECVAGPGGPMIFPYRMEDVIAPMELEQTSENKYIGVKIKRRDSTGAEVSGVWSFGMNWEETGVQPTEYRTVDWRHIKYATDALRRPALNAICHRTFRVEWSNPRVKFDILHLANHAREGDRAYALNVARAILRIECGDWVPFGRDWPTEYRGAKLVTGFTEIIRPDEWSIELNVQNVQQITGKYGVAADPAPIFPSYPWDRHDLAWNAYDGTYYPARAWNSFGTHTFLYFNDIETFQ